MMGDTAKCHFVASADTATLRDKLMAVGRIDKSRMIASSSLPVLTFVRFQPNTPSGKSGGIEVRGVADSL